eukprot:COSAG05_NODE_517_length_9060_cov_7.019306_9_plen_63_part_00
MRLADDVKRLTDLEAEARLAELSTGEAKARPKAKPKAKPASRAKAKATKRDSAEPSHTFSKK